MQQRHRTGTSSSQHRISFVQRNGEHVWFQTLRVEPFASLDYKKGDHHTPQSHRFPEQFHRENHIANTQPVFRSLYAQPYVPETK